MSAAGKKRKTRAERESEELEECGRKATELLLASTKAVREMHGLRDSEDPDVRWVQTHVRATCQFMSDKRQQEMEATLVQVYAAVEDLDSNLNGDDGRLRELVAATEMLGNGMVAISDSIK
jgi:RNA processing factor Prp31